MKRLSHYDDSNAAQCTLCNRGSSKVLMYKGKMRFSSRSRENRYLGKDEIENLSDTVWKCGKDQTLQN